jgi:DNA-binding transcriptional MerR regulator
MKVTRHREQLLTTSSVGRLLNISPDMVRYLERRGELPASKTTSGQRLFRLKDVKKLARARGVRGEVEPPSDTA